MGAGYFIDNRNTLTLSGSIAKGNFKNNDLISILRDSIYNIDPSTIHSEIGSRSSSSEAHFQNIGSMLSFKHNFAKANKDISPISTIITAKTITRMTWAHNRPLS